MRAAVRVRARRDSSFGLLLTLPAVLLMVALIGVPAVQTVLSSFRRTALSGETTFIGVANYEKLLASSEFHSSLFTSLNYTIGYVVLATGLGLAFALLLNQRFALRGLGRSLLILPWAIPVVLAGLIWRGLLDRSAGGLNAALSQLGIIDDYIPWLASGAWALFFTILAAVWHQASFAALLFLAALQTIPNEVTEAARVDGASPWQNLRLIVLPWIRPMTIVVLVVNAIYGVLQFDTVFAMTQGGPGDATMLLPVLLYRQMFVFGDIGLASATAVVVAFMALSLSALAVLLRRGDRAPIERAT